MALSLLIKKPTIYRNGLRHSVFMRQRYTLIARPRLLRSFHTSPSPQQVSQAELLSQARGFFERLKIRIKYPLMRQIRPWTLNDATALFSWLFLGHTVWLLAGTTSFVSLILWTANSLQFQEWTAYRIGKYLTSATGATVVFESAIVPNWKDGKIRFNNVRIYRMPRSEREKFERQQTEEQHAVECSNNDDNPLAGVELDEEEKKNEVLREWMWYNLAIDRVEVSLSLIRWLDGKGLVQSADVQGVRGVVDRRHVRWDPDVPYDPVAARHQYTPGDFELEKLVLEDILVTVYQPNGFRPYPVSIFHAQLDRFRKQWLFYDLLCATTITGAFDKCLFSLHSPQLEKSVLEQSEHIDSNSKRGFRSHDIYHYYRFNKEDPNGVLVGGETARFGVLTDNGMMKQGYKRKSRLRIDGVKIDHLFRGLEGPPGWITAGTLDMCADIYIPREAAEADSSELLRQLVHELTDSIDLPQPLILGAGKGELIVGGQKRIKKKEEDTNSKKFVIDVDYRFKETKASVPLHTPDLSYLNSAMVRPVVNYISRNKAIVPIKTRIVMDLSHFDGSWSVYDSTLSDRLGEKLGQAFVDLTSDQQERNKRLKRIGFWSLKEMTRNLVFIHDMMRGTSRGFWSYLGTDTPPLLVQSDL
ncbi:mitochondrial distribution and morphology protein family 31/32 [Sporodiniella umbellata]|nr:mitochondrial distribution and morphology protein family 31/32 [Sporodiniella umbellata]